MRGAEAQRAEEEMKAGLIPPKEGLERMDTGMPMTQQVGIGKAQLQQQIVAALEGAPMKPSPFVDPVMAVQEIMKAAAVVGPYARSIRLEPLEQLLMGYRELAQAAVQQQMMMAQAGAGGGKPPGKGKPAGKPGAPPVNGDKMEMAQL